MYLTCLYFTLNQIEITNLNHLTSTFSRQILLSWLASILSSLSLPLMLIKWDLKKVRSWDVKVWKFLDLCWIQMTLLYQLALHDKSKTNPINPSFRYFNFIFLYSSLILQNRIFRKYPFTLNTHTAAYAAQGKKH